MLRECTFWSRRIAVWMGHHEHHIRSSLLRSLSSSVRTSWRLCAAPSRWHGRSPQIACPFAFFSSLIFSPPYSSSKQLRASNRLFHPSAIVMIVFAVLRPRRKRLRSSCHIRCCTAPLYAGREFLTLFCLFLTFLSFLPALVSLALLRVASLARRVAAESSLLVHVWHHCT